MARKINEQEFSNHRREILDAAQGLILSKGYNRMSIQDIIDQLGISKGAFYHYFDSKHSVLESMIERLMQQGVEVLIPILEDPSIPAIKKLELFFSTVSNWKVSQKEYILSLLAVWYTEENIIVREKQIVAGRAVLTPLLEKIIDQGLREGVMKTPFIDKASQIVFTIMMIMGDEFARSLLLFVSKEGSISADACFDQMKEIATSYTDAIEKVLGIKPGSLDLLSDKVIMQWVLP